MFTHEVIVQGAAVRVAVAQVEDGLYLAKLVEESGIEAYGETEHEALRKACARLEAQGSMLAA